MAVTERAIDAMARAGCIGMKFGVESADPEVLKKLKKPINIEKVRKVASWCAKRGIKTHATITFGLEADTPETMQKTLDFCCSLPVDSIQFSTTTPFPGTEHYRNAKAAGQIDDGDWSKFDGARSSVLTYRSMSAEFVEEFTMRAPSRLAPRPAEGSRVGRPPGEVFRARRAGPGRARRPSPRGARHAPPLQSREVRTSGGHGPALRVLMLNHNVVWRSTFFRAFYLARELADLGHDVTVATISAAPRPAARGLRPRRRARRRDAGLGRLAREDRMGSLGLRCGARAASAASGSTWSTASTAGPPSSFRASRSPAAAFPG